MPSYRLVAAEGTQSFDLPSGRSVVVGRGVSSDIALYDPTISRRHAELTAGPDGVQVRDLGSSNGTSVNGARVAIGLMQPDDSIAFGKVVFQLEQLSEQGYERRRSPGNGLTPHGTIVRQLHVRGGIVPVEITMGGPAAVGQLRLPGTKDERTTRKLSLLLEISQKLSGELDLDRLLGTVADVTFEIMNVDRVAILLRNDATGELVPRVVRSRLEEHQLEHVPRSIAQKVVDERVAVLSHDAAVDQRFQGHSIALQSVRSAMCSPLMAEGDRVLGLLYVDNLTSANSFSDEDLQFLVAFSGLAAIGIRNSRYAEQLQQEATVRSNFERYFAPNVAAEIVQHKEAIRLGGERLPLTILFSDIRGFTSLSEAMAPEEIVQLLTDYFSEMVEIVFEHGGTLDKFIGDAIMALWGAPIAHADDADRALSAAIAMQKAVGELNARWAAEGRPTIGVGIGINYGEAFAGNIGSHRRLEYTVIGDAVNTAARICKDAEAGEILVSGAFRAACQRRDCLEPALELSLRGKSAAVEVWRVGAPTT
ncbi:MAG TPA: adenylate/guanylate cyclase domain-containing protein [Gemmatimonadales bacterium]|nr:adenylate/guanylate cyclase domain-containing protein [Gemmatimonadales bacterium]